MTEKSPFSNVHHVGVMVRDIDKAIEYYESLGIGPFETFSVAVEERRLRGKLLDAEGVKPKIRMARIGPIKLELIQPVPGKESIWGEFLEKRGEGAQHLGFATDDIERDEAELIKKGFNPIYRSRFKNGGGAAYFDIDRIGGIIFELFQGHD